VTFTNLFLACTFVAAFNKMYCSIVSVYKHLLNLRLPLIFASIAG